MENINRKNWLLRNSGVVVTTAFNFINKLKPRRKPNKMKRVPAPLAVPPMAPLPLGDSKKQQCNGAPPVQPAVKRTPNDFVFGKLIGEGSFSNVYLAKDIHTNKEYAIKVCEKQHIIKERKAEYVKREKDVLNMLCDAGAPFFVKLYCTFQDLKRLYFVLSYAKHGELFSHINRVGSLDSACARFYAGEILVALEHLHRLKIIHRDLKPENILLDENMHVMITDFGSAKIVSNVTGENEEKEERLNKRRNSFVGTAQYVSPELLTEKRVSLSSDLWAFGCIIYQMISGLPPFRSRSEYIIFQKILKLEYEFPEGFCPIAQTLVERLLVVDSSERLGASDENGYPSIRQHPFFQGLQFDTLVQSTPPTISPYIPSASDDAVPDHLEPGLDDRQLTRLLGLELQVSVHDDKRQKRNIADLSQSEISRMLEQQRSTNSQWHNMVEGNLILKQGIVDKKKGLFARRRMLLLTLGPHLYYCDPVNMVLKGEIPWSPEITVEPKNFKVFFVNTPNRTYYLEDPDGFALEWCKAIEDVRDYVYRLNT